MRRPLAAAVLSTTCGLLATAADDSTDPLGLRILFPTPGVRLKPALSKTSLDVLHEDGTPVHLDELATRNDTVVCLDYSWNPIAAPSALELAQAVDQLVNFAIEPPAGVQSVTAWLASSPQSSGDAAPLCLRGVRSPVSVPFVADPQAIDTSAVFYMHVPKTGGSSIIASLPQSYRTFFYGFPKRPSPDKPDHKAFFVLEKPPCPSGLFGKPIVDHLTLPDLVDCGIAPATFFDNKFVLCTVRHPYDRFLSQLNVLNVTNLTPVEQHARLRDHCEKTWWNPQEPRRHSAAILCRPQTDYTHPRAWRGGRGVCDAVVDTHDIDTVGKKILAEHGVVLDTSRRYNTALDDRSRADLSDQTKRWIESRYRRDFDVLGFPISYPELPIQHDEM